MAGKLGVVVVAAGKGSRMGTKESKQYILLQGKPILVHTLLALQSVREIDEIVLVTGSADMERCREYIEQYGIDNVRSIVAGGTERQHSVYEGLRQLSAGIEWALIHDGVRPFIDRDMVLRCWRKSVQEGAAVLAVPVKDTIKRVHESGVIESTPDRRSLWAIQTPQAFRRSLLEKAHEQARAQGVVGTDDAMLVELLGVPVHVVEGDYRNIKITTPEDLDWAEFLLTKGIEGK